MTTRKSRIHELYFWNIYKRQEKQTQTFIVFMILLKTAGTLWYQRIETSRQTRGFIYPLYSIKPALVRLHDLYSPDFLEPADSHICTPSPGDDRILALGG
jgi:hypothetical protein